MRVAGAGVASPLRGGSSATAPGGVPPNGTVSASRAESGSLATVTVVRPDLQWGVAELAGDEVTGFVEKPRSEHWINGGFLCFEPGVFDYLGPDSVLEREPLSQ